MHPSSYILATGGLCFISMSLIFLTKYDAYKSSTMVFGPL